MRILVAGGGSFGKEHIRTLTAIGGVQLAVAEPRLAELDHIRSTTALADQDTDPFALLDRFKPQGVIVVAPAAVHAPLAIAALDRGIPALVEKPVAPDSATMRRLCDCARRSAAFLQPGHILRFSSAHRELLRALRHGEIGTLLQFSSQRYRDASHAARYTDIDPVLMTLIHDIDLALWFDEGTALYAYAARRPAGTAQSVTTAALQSTSGAVWHVSTAWLHPGPQCPPDRVEIVGTKGSATLTVGDSIEIFGESCRRIDMREADDPLRTQLECFLQGVRSGVLQAPVTPEDALNGLLAAEMILQSLSRQ
jgi:predicted dehydrogenase